MVGGLTGVIWTRRGREYGESWYEDRGSMIGKIGIYHRFLTP